MEKIDPNLKTIHVLIADDSALVRKVLEQTLLQQDDMTIVAMATNGKEALDLTQAHEPDVLILDVEMPELDGIEVLRELRKVGSKSKVVLLSNVTQRFAPVTVQGLALGAVGYIPKPSATEKGRSLEEISAQLLDLIRSVAAKSMQKAAAPIAQKPRPKPSKTGQTSFPQHIELAVMASSTGGPNALSSFFKALEPPSYPMVIVQHMPKLFLPQLAERLSMESKLPFKIAEHNGVLKPGVVYVAPGEIHTKIERNEKGELISVLFDGPPEVFCKPSANPLFRSSASVCKEKCIALVFTGMGNDGYHASSLLKHYGGYMMIQDKASSVVWGMPGAIAEAQLHDEEGSPLELATRLNMYAAKLKVNS